MNKIKLKYMGIQLMVNNTDIGIISLVDEAETRHLSIVCDRFTKFQFDLRSGLANTEEEPVQAQEKPAAESREIPDELVETKTIADEFKVDFTRFKENVENSTPSEQTQPEGEKKQLDFSLHTVELMHQSASSLAKLENLFGKK